MKVILKYIAEIITLICALLSVIMVAHGEPVSDRQFYLWLFTCSVWVINAALRKD